MVIVDDSQLVLEAGRRTLEEAGIQVITIDNPLMLHRTVGREQPDLVLIDVNMPALNGDALAQVIRNSEKGRGVSLVLFSDMPEEELSDRAKRCGAKAYIKKSEDPSHLLREVVTLLAAEKR